MRISGRAMEYALERTRQVQDLGAGKVDVAQVPAARLTGLARYGLTSKAPTLKRLEIIRQTATLLATVRHLETATVDDALGLLDALIAAKLLAMSASVEGSLGKLRAGPGPFCVLQRVRGRYSAIEREGRLARPSRCLSRQHRARSSVAAGAHHVARCSR
jgi:hypothetical protein